MPAGEKKKNPKVEESYKYKILFLEKEQKDRTASSDLGLFPDLPIHHL